MKHLPFCIAASLLLIACCTTKQQETMSSIKEKTILATIDSILVKSPQADATLLKKGVRNAAGFWKKSDGTAKDFQAFCIDHFMDTPEKKATLFNTIQRNLEIINGHYNRISMELKEPVQLAGPDYTSVDESFGALDPYAHFADDMFDSKIAFSVLLNFPFYTLQEKNALGNHWNRQEWAYARMGDLFTSRVPAGLSQHVSTELAATENYISNYNIKMDRLRTEDGRQLFADSMSLIAHWGLRDELKADYADKKNGLEKQQLIYEVMKRIIDQTIPEQIINDGKRTWKPYSNQVFDGTSQVTAKSEPDTRYKHLFSTYQAMKETDPYNRCYPTALKRAFDKDMEVSADNIETMFTSLIASPEVARVAALIKSRLGRNLQPFDLWYDGFKTRSTIPEERLTQQTRTRYPNTQAFEKGMPELLTNMGFSQADANDISAKVQVDNSRGSGHAWGAQMRSDKAHLRTRVQPSGMDYKGYNIATHEFGHNVEETISLNRVDYYLLNGIPSSAFTEALAFVFQSRDLDLLGYGNANPQKQALETLDNFWGSYEIMGVSLVEIRTWKWLYEHPKATVASLKETIIKNAKDIWNQYYAPYLGEKDSPILAIYSHMIEYPLYLSNYPYGQLVEFQLEKKFGDKKPGEEILRMFSTGRLTPDHWMKIAVGEVVSIKPMLEATDAALTQLH